MSDFYFESKLKARKEHKCLWCGQIIKPKEEYYKCGGVHQGYFGFRKECANCHDAIVDYTYDGDYDNGDGLDTDWLREFWLESKCRKCTNWNKEDEECNKDDMTHNIRCDNYLESEVTK